MLAGWGIFNLVEGVIDHAILGLHHVREGGSETPWDLGFLAFGVVLIVGGWLLVRSAGRRAGDMALGDETFAKAGIIHLHSSLPR